VIAGTALVLGACGGAPSGAGLELDGTWVLEEGTHDGRPVPIVEGARITMNIDGAEIGGTSACNLYGGTIERDGSQITIGALTTTEMACAEPIMASEAAYIGALADVTTASRDGDSLVLSGPGVELDFRLLPPVPTAELVGTVWTLDSLISGDSVSSVAGEPATLELRGDGTLSGSTGCRSFSGSYEVAGDEVRVTDLAASMQSCPEELAGQDDQVLAVIGDGFTVKIDGDRLTLSDGASGLGYRAAPSQS
jgi:heat shock protein HslJ